MNKTIKSGLTIFLSLLFALCSLRLAKADQYGQYGGVQVVSQLSLDKKVLNPAVQTEEYVDNLFVSQYLFQADQEVKFKITVTNTGSSDQKVKVKDILPKDYLFTQDSRDFTINSSTQDLEKDLDLKAGESKDLYFTAKVQGRDKLPQAGGYYCVVNTAQTWIDGSSTVYQDQAQICISVEAVVTKGGQPVVITTLPPTGPVENLAVLLGSSILAITGGVLVKNKKRALFDN